MANILCHSMEVINSVRSKTGRVILFYSCQKDSIVLLDLIAPYFKEVVCVFMYFVADLEHVNKHIRKVEAKYQNVRFIQVQHWFISSIKHNASNPDVKILKLCDIVKTVKAQKGIDYCFLGLKQSDSFNRLLMLRGYDKEAINETFDMIYPLSKWTDKDVESYIYSKGLISPIEHTIKKNCSDLKLGLEAFSYLSANYPNDLKKILKEYPLTFSETIEKIN